MNRDLNEIRRLIDDAIDACDRREHTAAKCLLTFALHDLAAYEDEAAAAAYIALVTGPARLERPERSAF